MAVTRRLAVAAVLSLVIPAAMAQFAERNVNMVSGTTYPGGDPFLRQQNEPSIAVSALNPLHLLAGANDYRSVDIPFSAPARPDEEETGDAWLGYFISKDGGNRWSSTLIDGYPQQNNTSSPLNGFQAAADPVVRAADHGLFYYAGIVLNRGTNPLSGVFIARFIDRNNTEGGNPIAFLDTKLLSKGSSGQFIDKVWLAVAPTTNGGQCTVDGQTFSAQNVYLAYSILVGNDNNIRTKIMATRSTDCGTTWATPMKLSETYSVNQGVNIAVDPSNSNNVYIAWRRFADGNDPNSIIIAKSSNAGATFTKGTVVANITPFDQGTTDRRIRTNAYPTMAVDSTGRVYIAWSQRGSSPDDGRIVMTSSSDGLTGWTMPTPVAPIIGGTSDSRGHQFMPTMTFSGGKLTLAWYDLRDDSTVAGYTLNMSTKTYTISRVRKGNLFLGQPQIVFWTWMSDLSPDPATPLERRHTLDVYATESTGLGVSPTFADAVRITRYKYGSLPPAYDTIEDFQINPPNLPMFRQGTVPFFGDYIDVSAYVSNGATVNGNARVRHVVWTDNRDVRAPRGAPPDWTKYTPVSSSSLGATSIFDPTQTPPPCTVDADGNATAGSRNQNIYTTRVTDGLFAGSPSNAKALGTIKRAFTIFVQNATNVTHLYHLSFGTIPDGTTASFTQFDPIESTLDVNVPAHSTATRTVFVTSPTQTRIDVIVTVVGGGLTTVISLNPDPLNTGVPAANEVFNPEVANPEVANPEVANPEVANPEVANPEVANPEVANPEVANPEVANPEVANPEVANPEVANPEVANPEVANTDVGNASYTDTTWNATNEGTSTGGYTVKLFKLQPLPPGVSARLILNKIYETPIARGCKLGVEYHKQIVASIKDPQLITDINQLFDPSLTDPSEKNATMWLAPGEVGRITVRLMSPTPGQTLAATDFFVPVAISQAVNTADAANGSHTPPVSLTITTASLPGGAVGQPYTATLTSIGGVGTPTWSTAPKTPMPGGLTLAPSGAIFGTPTVAGTFLVTIIATDAATPTADTASKTFTLQIGPVRTFFVTNTNDFGPGSLRQAILDSNANVERTDTVVFAIPGAAPHIIRLFSPLPTISDPVVLDATASGACDGNPPSVEIDGVSAGAVSGLVITGGGTTIRGLAVTRFASPDAGIFVNGGSGSVIQCSYIGLAPDGVTAKGNSNGIRISSSSNNLIGGTGTARNVVSGNNREGVRIDLGATANVVQGNYIGTTASGAADLGNSASGVYLRRAAANSVLANVISGNDGFAGVAICGNPSACGGGEDTGLAGSADGNVVKSNLIGTNAAGTVALGNSGFGVSIDGAANTTVGGDAGQGNVIAASGSNAVHIFNSSDANLIRGNSIGTDPTGTLNLGNGGAGVFIATGSNNIIGGDPQTNGTASNVIEFNGGAGIDLLPGAGSGNLLRFNRIDANGGIGIDLGNDGVTANDSTDHIGPNNFQNFPVITSVTSNSGVTVVNGTLESTAATQFVIDFFQSATCDASSYGEGRTWFGAFTGTTDASGSLAISARIVVPVTGVVTALATAPDNSTSEFSACAAVVTANTVVGALQYPKGLFVQGGQVYLTETAGRNTSFGGRISLDRVDLASGALTTLLNNPTNSDALVVSADGTVYLTSYQGSIPGDVGALSVAQLGSGGTWQETPVTNIAIASDDMMYDNDGSNNLLIIGSSDSPTAQSLIRVLSPAYTQTQVIRTGLGRASSLTKTGGYTYYSQFLTDQVRRFNSDVDELFIGGVTVVSLDTDGTWIYYAELNGGIKRKHIVNGTVETLVQSAVKVNTVRWDAASGRLYFVEAGTIAAQYKDGALRYITIN